ncbi:unnamed protein product [Parajaminaea phylloscopi]
MFSVSLPRQMKHTIDDIQTRSTPPPQRVPSRPFPSRPDSSQLVPALGWSPSWRAPTPGRLHAKDERRDLP